MHKTSVCDSNRNYGLQALRDPYCVIRIANASVIRTSAIHTSVIPTFILTLFTPPLSALPSFILPLSIHLIWLATIEPWILNKELTRLPLVTNYRSVVWTQLDSVGELLETTVSKTS